MAISMNLAIFSPLSPALFFAASWADSDIRIVFVMHELCSLKDKMQAERRKKYAKSVATC